MFDTDWIDDLDGDAACAAVAGLHRARLETEAQLLYLAGHWADLHNGDALDARGRVLPGMERARRLGAPGTPKVAEFAVAEFATLQGLHPGAGRSLVRDALNLRHRHPLLWQRAIRGEVRVWQACEVARRVGSLDLGLSAEAARQVDAVTTAYLGALPWGRFLNLLEAKIIEADPAAAEERRQAAAAERFVATGQCDEFGLKTLIARASAGDVIFFVAMVDRIAAILAMGGDTDPVGVRRSKAIGILANPARALVVLQSVHEVAAGEARLPDRCPDPREADAPTGPATYDDTEPDEDREPSEDDVAAWANDADDPASPPCPTCRGGGATTGDPTAFVMPKLDPAHLPAKLLPPATLYVHVHHDAFLRGQDGVARFEGVGPITVEQSAEFLGHTNVRVQPVIDIANQTPVDAYEVPTRMGEALRLRNPAGVFPFSPNLSRKKDLDHTAPYFAPRNGGPPRQTCLGNLGPLERFGHRLKTHGRWRLKQPEPGTYLWRSPHGSYYHVDHTGTHPLAKTVGDAAWAMLDRGVDIHPCAEAIDYEPARHLLAA